MTTTTGLIPTIRILTDLSSNSLGAAMTSALTMLRDARRIVLVGDDQRPDIIHTVGHVSAPARSSTHHVHSVDTIPLRAGRLVAAGWWVRSERRGIGGAAAVLAHGQTAVRLLVDAGLAPGERVYRLPLVAPPGCATATTGARARLREHLGVSPGVRLVLGVDSHAQGNRAGGWDSMLLAAGRCDVSVAQIRPSDAPDSYHVRVGSGSWLDAPIPLAELLLAADLYVAAGHQLDAYTPAVAAVECGVPMVAVTTDSVAELVLSGSVGCVVPAHRASVVQAVIAQLEGGLPPRRPLHDPPDQPRRCAELAHGLLGAYRRVLCAGVVVGAA